MSGALAAEGPADLAAAAEASIETFAGELARIMADRPAERIRAELALGCWIHGAGLFGRRLAALLQAEGFPVVGFIDRRGGAELSSHMGLPVRHPDALDAAHARGRTFVGGVLNPGAASQDVLPWARGLPFGAFVLGADLPDALGEGAMTCWQAPRSLIHRNLDAIWRTAGRLSDRASLDIYMGLLMYRLTGDPTHHPKADTDNAYLPQDLPGFDRPITFVDAGAYTGDSCAHLMGRGVEVSRYVAFEPDRLNVERLGEFVRASPIRDATLLPCGLSDRLRTVQLEGEGVSCRLVEAGAGPSVLCVALDAVLPALAPDFVKMDIEGGELAALKGMTGAIGRGRPRLAISIYHRPEDLWEIPQWVGDRYDRLYIRQHGAHGFDTVLYALPRAN